MDEEALRAQVYGLLAVLLAAPPSPRTLAVLAQLDGGDTALGQAFAELGKAARTTDADTAEDEYFRLFVGVAGGELTPYASWYRTGFLHEKPLAVLRADLARLGIERDPACPEPEDHVASLMETMQGLISGAFGQPLPLPGQKAFFDAHIAGWAGDFFRDLEGAGAASLYRPLGSLGRIFLGVEAEAFAMV
ncbi:MAG: molecular chaperone [Actinomycetota bacterium]